MNCKHPTCPLLEISLIPLTQGKYAIVDTEDYDWLMRWKWYAIKSVHTFYAGRYVSTEKGRQRKSKMHRVILGVPKNMEVDHESHYGLDNRRSNLRRCTRQQNQRNRKLNRNNKSGFKGVAWCKAKNIWQSYIRINGKTKHLGHWTCIVKAAKAYDTAARKHFGEFAHTNF